MKRSFLISGVLLLSIACFSQTKKWEKTQKINTIEAYQKFLTKYPDSEYSKEAENKMIKLEFYNAKLKYNVKALEIFLAKYPQSKFETNAIKRIEKLNKIKGTLLSYELGQTTYAKFNRDKEAGSWKTKVTSMNVTTRAEPGKSSSEGEVLGSSVTVIITLPSSESCKLEFKGKGNLYDAPLIRRGFF